MARGGKSKAPSPAKAKRAESYEHKEAKSLLRPDIGTQAQFRKKKPPQRYRYDSSLSPALEWDGQNPAREQGEALLRQVLEAETLERAKQAAEQLKAIGRPFLNWAGKAERLSFDVPTLPLFVHERLSTKAILETLKGHRRNKQLSLLDLFGDPQRPIHEQVLRAYEYPDDWVNRMILGDSLVVMNSLLHYEQLGGQVQMIYMDPPYGVKFGSNFQPFVRKRDVRHSDDTDMTREPEMVKAYRDTWELGVHSYLTYLRDRLLVCRDLLTSSGSIFVQISDENVHHVRELLDEVFGADNFVALITFRKTTSATAKLLGSTADYLLWYARDRERCKFRRAFTDKLGTTSTVERYDQLELADGARRALTPEEKANPEIIPQGARRYQLDNLTSTRPPGNFPVLFNGREYRPRSGYWKTGPAGMQRLIEQRRVVATEGGTLRYVRYLTDFPLAEVDTLWTDISGAVQSRSDPKVYAVQTSTQVVQRCLSMTTDPGDLILDPTCGSGTTAYSAEQWARRWITIDASRVPLALARQRLLTATFHYYRLKEPERGPAGGFSYVRKQNSRGEEIGGVIPHIQLQTIANREPPKEEVLVDRPEVDSGITRVTGPFWFEATIPTPVDWDGDGIDDSGFSAESYSSFIDRMLEVLRRSPILHLGGGKRIELTQLRKPAKTLSLSAEALAIGTNVRREERKQLPPDEPVVGDPSETYGESKAVAIVFGPENGSISEKLVYEAAREAHAKSFHHLYVIGFAIQPNARALVEKCDQVVGVAATYVQATPDLMMGDLLKNMRSSQIFSVCGLPEVGVRRHASEPRSEPHYQVELLGLDVFDPATMNVDHQDGRNVPAWLLDTDYNGLCFHVCQAFFPRTSAWDDLKRSLKGEFEDSVWEHLAGTTSAPFEAGEHGQIAVKVIDDRGNELLVVKQLSEASE